MSGLRTTTIAFVGGLCGVALWLAVWQWFTVAGPLAGVVGIPTMSGSAARALDLVADPVFWSAVVQTVGMAVQGLAFAVVVGVVLGLVTGLSRAADAFLDPSIQFLRPLPSIVILPLALLVIGPNRELGVFLAAFGAIWPIVVQVQAGVRDTDPVSLDVARSMNLSWVRTQTAVVLPGAAPYIMTGIRIAASAALLLAIGAGLLGGAPGLGNRILIAQESNQPDLAFGYILWSGVLGLTLALLLTLIERVILRGRRELEDYA